MKEQLISFDTAKLAKDKGFRIDCKLTYYQRGEQKYVLTKATASNRTQHFEFIANAPVQSLLQKWLREVHNIHISIYPIGSSWEGDVRDCNSNERTHSSINTQVDGKNYKTYEEVLEVGLQEALKLI